MNLKYFTHEAYKLLKNSVALNKEHYLNDDNWLPSFFKNNGIEEYYNTSQISVPNIVLSYSGNTNENINLDDFQNTQLIYQSYKDKITPLQASDFRLWTALCHMVFSSYILKRWKNNEGVVNISAHFFATSGRASLLYYNAISRFWWSGYLTYEEEKSRSNPWELTKVLFSAQQIQKDLTDQPFSMNRKTVKGLLKALKRIQEIKGNACTNIFRDCCDSYLNHYGAVTILDFLTEDDIEEIAYNYMIKRANGA